MRAMVCLTGAVDPEERLEFVPGSGASNLGTLRRVLNRADACALEQALRLRDGTRAERVEVIAVTMGPQPEEVTLREALGQGADGAVRLWGDSLAAADAHTTASVLAGAARLLGAGLVLTGDRARDGDTSQVPVRMAELLGWPLVANAVRLELAGEHEAVAEQGLERGLRQRVRCSLPVLVSLCEGATRPRYPRLRDRLAAKAAVITLWSPPDLGIDAGALQAGARCTLVRISPPKPSTRGTSMPDPELSPEDRLAQILGGGLDPRPAAAQESPKGPLRGPPVGQAREIARFLVEGKFV